jgi:glutamine amidotransferase
MIAIIDYDVGNVDAIKNMLGRLGFESKITSDLKDIESASRIILPGNGSYDACLRKIKSNGLIPLLEFKVFEEHTPLLGICVGAQILGNFSNEGKEKGLGWVDMEVVRFPKSLRLPVPNMGWRNVSLNIKNHYLIANMDADPRFYFVHSYFMKPKNEKNILLLSDYGFPFAAAIVQDNIIGVQFHPEKSHRFGRALLSAFAGNGF